MEKEKIQSLDKYNYAHYLLYDICPFCGLKNIKIEDYLEYLRGKGKKSPNQDDFLIYKNLLKTESGSEKTLFCKKCFRTFKLYQDCKNPTGKIILSYKIIGYGRKDERI